MDNFINTNNGRIGVYVRGSRSLILANIKGKSEPRCEKRKDKKSPSLKKGGRDGNK